jgi:hypothetical protein
MLPCFQLDSAAGAAQLVVIVFTAVTLAFQWLMMARG